MYAVSQPGSDFSLFQEQEKRTIYEKAEEKDTIWKRWCPSTYIVWLVVMAIPSTDAVVVKVL